MNTVSHRFATLALAAALVTPLAACSGRDPLVSKNDDAAIPPPPPPPTPKVRTLAHGKTLFGTMPVDNRFQDPLMTFTGSGWFAFANDYNSYGKIFRRVAPSPTNSAYLSVPLDKNPRGATIIGQLKTSQAPLHIEAWVGVDGEDGSFDGVDVELAGLFVDGGEQSVPLAVDASTRVFLDQRTWQRYSADVDVGPIGWSYLTATSTASYALGGAVAVDVNPGANASFVSAHRRPLSDRQRLLIQAVQERTRTLALPHAPEAHVLPGLPPQVPTAG